MKAEEIAREFNKRAETDDGRAKAWLTALFTEEIATTGKVQQVTTPEELVALLNGFNQIWKEVSARVTDDGLVANGLVNLHQQLFPEVYEIWKQGDSTIQADN